MDKNVLIKNVDIDGRKFILGKFNARDGSYILFKLVGILTPIFASMPADKLEKLDELSMDDINFTELASSLFSLPKDDFTYIQDNCLMVIKEMLPGGTPQILNEFGVWGNDDLEFNTKIILELTIKSLVFNVSGFFGESLLKSLHKGLTSFQQNAKI